MKILLRGHIRKSFDDDSLYNLLKKIHSDVGIELYIHTWNVFSSSKSWDAKMKEDNREVTADIIRSYLKDLTSSIVDITIDDEKSVEVNGEVEGCVGHCAMPLKPWKYMIYGMFSVVNRACKDTVDKNENILLTRFDILTDRLGFPSAGGNPFDYVQHYIKTHKNTTFPLLFSDGRSSTFHAGCDNLMIGHANIMYKFLDTMHLKADEIISETVRNHGNQEHYFIEGRLFMERNILSAPAFVVHLPRCTERVEFFTKNISDAGFTDMRVFEGVDGRDVNARSDAMLLFNAPPIDMEIAYGQIGCLFSHLKVLKHIIDNDIPLATVFEDDVHFHPEWKTLSKTYWKLTPIDFDILFIGNGLDSCRTISDPSTIQEITIEGAWCTHAYVVTREGAEKVMNAILNWDYTAFNHGSRGNTLTGLYAIDIMLINLEHRALLGQIEKPFIWYCWNGTKHPCASNKLPTTGNDTRNTGLVFQNADVFKSSVGEHNDEVNDNFYDEYGNILDITNYETTDRWIADTFISPDATVLELGGRLGVVSVHINKRLTDTRRHYVVEPDEKVFTQMFRNIVSRNLNPRTFNGTISKKPLYFQPDGIVSRARETACSCDSFIVPNKTLKQVIQETGLRFDTLVANCEGCLEGFIDENIDYLDNFKMITFEEDCQSECDYEKIKRILGEHHFVCVRPGVHSVWQKQVPPPHPPQRKLLSFLRIR